MTRYLPPALSAAAIIILAAVPNGPTVAQDAGTRDVTMPTSPSSDVTPRGTRMIVSYADNASDEAIKAAEHAVQATVVRRMDGNRSALIRIPIGFDPTQAMAILNVQPAVREVALDTRQTVAPRRGPRIGD